MAQHGNPPALEVTMVRTRFAVTLAGATIAIGGLGILATPAPAESFACNERQIEYVRDVIREECGSWGGRAWVRCSGHDVEFVGIECNAT